MSRGKLGKKPEASPVRRSTSVLRDTTVLDPLNTAGRVRGPARARRPLCAWTHRDGLTDLHYDRRHNRGPVATITPEESPPSMVRTRVPRLKTRRSVPARPRTASSSCSRKPEEAAQSGATPEDAPSAGLACPTVELLPPHSSSSDWAGESLKQIKVAPGPDRPAKRTAGIAPNGPERQQPNGLRRNQAQPPQEGARSER